MTRVLDFPFWLLVVHPVLFFVGFGVLVLLTYVSGEENIQSPVMVYRNGSDRRWGRGRLPIKHSTKRLILVWAGPLFILLRPWRY